MQNSQNKTYNVVALGARDYYQVAVALHDAGKLNWLITDFYLPDFLRSRTSKRWTTGLPKTKTFSLYPWAVLAKLLRSGGRFNRSHRLVVDWLFGFIAGGLTYLSSNRAIVYSYYIEGFTDFYRLFNLRPNNLICFQVHPTPWFVNKLIDQDINLYKKIKKIDFNEDMEATYSDSAIAKYMTALSKCDKIICASTATARSVYSNHELMVPHSIIPYGSKHESGSFRSRNTPAESDKIKLVSVCQLSQRKGLHWAFSAIESQGLESFFDWTIVSNKIDINIRSIAPSNVIFKANLSDEQLASEMAAADLFVMPSIIEGFGLVYIESLSMGTPIIYTANTGPNDFCVDGTHGFLVDASSLTVLEELFRRLTTDPRQLDQMRANCKFLATKITWDKFRRSIVNEISA